ncbi:hypothetical protein ACFXDE_33925 [Kitasatospora sp. NPDC059408]|uniref:hypothetical protein n=1 Tax=Kitasatospora sp. NPDC059408 TaxID=3346823 RepID=UPI0036C533B7
MDVMQVADAGAAALVVEMAKSTWSTARDAVARFFGRGSGQAEGADEVVEQELRLIDEVRRQLLEGQGQEGLEGRLRGQLTIQLAARLLKRPDAAEALQELIDQVAAAEGGPQARTSVHHNTNSQVVIASGAINAGGGIHYRSPESGR